MHIVRHVVYRTDEMEKLVRLRALDAAGEYTTLANFNVYTQGYLRALKDLKVDEKYIEIYKRVMYRLRNAYSNE